MNRPVEEIQRLDRRCRLRSLRTELPAVGTIEGTENGILLHANSVFVNHPSPFRRTEVKLRIEQRYVPTLWVLSGMKGTVTRATHSEIKIARYEQDRIANCFGLPDAAEENVTGAARPGRHGYLSRWFCSTVDTCGRIQFVGAAA